jgi:hypothetical protein
MKKEAYNFNWTFMLTMDLSINFERYSYGEIKCPFPSRILGMEMKDSFQFCSNGVFLKIFGYSCNGSGISDIGY